MKIYVIAPIIESEVIRQASEQEFLDREFSNEPDVQVISRFLERAPSSIENEIDEALCIPDLLRVASQARDEGADGILVNCMLDPGLRALRRALDVPVMGAAETCFHIAACLGSRFSVVDVCADTAPIVESQIRALGVQDRFASVRATGIAIEEITKEMTTTVRLLADASVKAIEDDGAGVIVLGCTGFATAAGPLRLELQRRHKEAPVIEPTSLAVRVLIAIVRAGVRHGKCGLQSPLNKKSLRGYPLDEWYTVLDKL